MTGQPEHRHEQQELDDLQRRIDEGKKRLAEMAGPDEEPRFIDKGELEGPVDNTIAPG